MQEQELIARVKALVPMLEQHADQAERERKPVDAVMKAIEDTGVYRYFVPKAYGGYEFSLEGFMDLGMALGEGCLSTAWVVTFCMEHNWLLGLYDKEAQDDIFGRQPYIIAPGALAPKGQAVPVEGGYRVSGRWEWGTGVMHADWVMVGALTPGDDPQRPELCMYLIPRGEVEVVDTWQMAGMVGTGSNDIEVKDVFVPGHLRVNLMDLRAGESPGAQVHDSPTYRMPMLPVLGLTAAAPAVGCARKAVKSSGNACRAARSTARPPARASEASPRCAWGSLKPPSGKPRFSSSRWPGRSANGARRASPARSSSGPPCGFASAGWYATQGTSSATWWKRAAPTPTFCTTRCSEPCVTCTRCPVTRCSTWTSQRKTTGGCCWAFRRTRPSERPRAQALRSGKLRC
jgi:hypothetical protein